MLKNTGDAITSSKECFDKRYKKPQMRFQFYESCISKRLMEKTDEYRKSKMSYKEYISSEDIGDDFNIRDFLDTLPIYGLKFLCDYCKIKGRSKLKRISHTNLNEH